MSPSPDDFRQRAKMVGRMIKLLAESDSELFMVESPSNRYRPAPPEGFIAFRSHKRRIFVDGRWPSNAADLEVLSAKIKASEFVESPLIDATPFPQRTSMIVDYMRP